METVVVHHKVVVDVQATAIIRAHPEDGFAGIWRNEAACELTCEAIVQHLAIGKGRAEAIWRVNMSHHDDHGRRALT